MNDKEFMQQKAEDMTVKELHKAIEIKNKPITFAEEINKFPERFERLTYKSWETVNNGHGVSCENTAEILNCDWNSSLMNDSVFYVEFSTKLGNYKEIIRRV